MTFAGRVVVALAHEGDVVTALGSRYRFKVLGDATIGAYSLIEETLLDPEGPPLHIHDHEEEGFYALQGRGAFVVGDDRRELTAGNFVLVPRGAAHGLASIGDEELRMLVITSPAGLEQFFVEVLSREAAGEPMSEE